MGNNEIDLFSKRMGLTPNSEIKIRYDAPNDLRGYLLLLMRQYEKRLKTIRQIVCLSIKVAPDSLNWAENSYMEAEVDGLLSGCQWPYVYDTIESFYKHIDEKDAFSSEINTFFQVHGIGWKLENGLIKYRGDDIIEQDLQDVRDTLDSRSFTSTLNEINEAIVDLSKRPNADTTGTVQHSIAALECLCREITGDKKDTLGTIVSNNPHIVPSPLDAVISKIWGYASENGRHLREGQLPQLEEAELLVHLSSSLCIYLAKKADWGY